ncbi:MAG: hypothetical protein CL609_04540 [Anaerolineaceae bacterium]|nr:hypothetical protein [Anaerolineaceae bacterium]
MKRILPLIFFSLLFVLSACGKQAAVVIENPSEILPTSTVDTSGAANVPTAKPAEPTQPPADPTESPNKPYDPSIFIIEASGSWQQELAPEYFANNEVEIYLHKIDANDNRAVSGSYQGVFWMRTTLDTAGFIQDMLGDAPIEMNFDAGAEAVSDNLAISLNTTDDKAWVDYSILDENGQPLPLTQDTPVGKGSFVAVAKEVYLDAKASGIQGEKVDYSTNEGTGDVIDINYVIHVQPNDMESGGVRKVTILLSGEGFSQIIEGTMRRISGYPEDVSDYLNSTEFQNSTWSRLGE